MSEATYGPIAAAAAQRYGIDPTIFARQIAQESGWETGLTSPSGARGIAQFMPDTAKALGIDPNDPQQALYGAASLMHQYLDQYGNYQDALTAYNAGPGAVGGELPPETQTYIANILGTQTSPAGGPGGSMNPNDVGPLLAKAGYKPLTSNPNDPSTWGPTAMWQAPDTKASGGKDSSGNEIVINVPGAVTSEAQLAYKMWGQLSPYGNPDANATTAYSGAGLPAGYVQGPGGIVMKQTATGLVPATAAELATINAPKPVIQTGPDGTVWKIDPTTGQLTRMGNIGTAPVGSTTFTGANGNLWRINPQTGVTQDTGVQVAFSAEEIRSQQQADQQDTQGFTSGENALNRQATADNQAAADKAAMERQQLTGENAARLQAMGDTEANRRALLNEQQANARADLQAQTQGFQSINTLAPQLGDLALRNAQFTSDTLSKPADFLARAFFTRGQTSPLPQVSQADVINQLGKNIAGFQGALDQYHTNFGGFNAQLPNVPTVSPAAGFRPPAAPAPAAPTATVVGTALTNPNAGAQNAGIPTSGAMGTPPPPSNVVDGNIPANTSGNMAWEPSLGFDAAGNRAPGFARGTQGFTTAPVARVGESPDGTPNTTEETLVNPTHAPVGIIPNPATVAGVGEPRGAAPQQGAPAPKVDPAQAALVKAIGFVSDPKTAHALVDELAKLKGKGVPRFANGTGIDITANPNAPWQTAPGTSYVPTMAPDQSGTGAIGFSAPNLPSPGTSTTQSALQEMERANRPPALNSLLAGQAPDPLQVGFNLPSKMSYNDLTPDEHTAFGTTLATQYNLAPSDVETAINQRYSTGSRGTAGFAG